jgi:hypothetical protein
MKENVRRKPEHHRKPTVCGVLAPQNILSKNVFHRKILFSILDELLKKKSFGEICLG